MKLSFDFYNRYVVDVAKDLLGKELIVGKHRGIITATEAYRGYDDEASHAFKGPTKRSQIMFGPPGHVYVYMIYGMYFCLNIVVEHEGQAGAVLIRGIKTERQYLRGPGKVCRAFGITTKQNNLNTITSQEIYIAYGDEVSSWHATTRIGVKKAQDKLWRFVAGTSLNGNQSAL